MFSFLKKKTGQAAGKDIGFEERERKTPIAGYVLLIAMTIVSLWLGFTALSDLENVPAKPQALSSCSVPFISYGWQDAWRFSGTYYEYSVKPVYSPEAAFPYQVRPPSAQPCVFSDIETKRGVAGAFAQTKGTRDQIANLQNQSNQKQNALSQLDSQINELRRQYELSIGEKGAKVSGGIYNIGELQTKLKPFEEQKTALVNEVANIQNQISAASDQLKPFNEKLRALYKEVLADWRVQWRWYELWAFLLQGLFVFPFFFIMLKTYFRLSAKNSPYTVIATFTLATASIFVVKIACVYFWSLLLAAILEALWDLINRIQILKSIITYAGMLLTIVLFGGAVYLLQRKIFNPARVALRYLRDKRCPSCQFSLELSKNFCPHCGEQILEKCPKCHSARFIRMAVCPHCGDRKT
ncbi:hypothetical protein HY250_02190 [Candidatus Azambacteria bacterium]|nr:hypothetical protein [Candidatus Azambacteria bacterium]MBI3685192.1 hypothetical protein [Candidatus Azambacteria bacterium]